MKGDLMAGALCVAPAVNAADSASCALTRAGPLTHPDHVGLEMVEDVASRLSYGVTFMQEALASRTSWVEAFSHPRKPGQNCGTFLQAAQPLDTLFESQSSIETFPVFAV